VSRRSGPNIRDGERKRPPVRITLSREAIDRLDEIARARGTTRSGAVEQLVRNARLGER
jgi:metal-responsive CopG/Arc/MetJ family transcriptional regulator